MRNGIFICTSSFLQSNLFISMHYCSVLDTTMDRSQLVVLTFRTSRNTRCSVRWVLKNTTSLATATKDQIIHITTRLFVKEVAVSVDHLQYLERIIYRRHRSVFRLSFTDRIFSGMASRRARRVIFRRRYIQCRRLILLTSHLRIQVASQQ